jgi:hypothetical protein
VLEASVKESKGHHTYMIRPTSLADPLEASEAKPIGGCQYCSNSDLRSRHKQVCYCHSNVFKEEERFDAEVYSKGGIKQKNQISYRGVYSVVS